MKMKQINFFLIYKQKKTKTLRIIGFTVIVGLSLLAITKNHNPHREQKKNKPTEVSIKKAHKIFLAASSLSSFEIYLAMITQLIPHQIWLTRFILTKNRLIIQGKTKEASKLYNLVENITQSITSLRLHKLTLHLNHFDIIFKVSPIKFTIVKKKPLIEIAKLIAQEKSVQHICQVELSIIPRQSLLLAFQSSFTGVQHFIKKLQLIKLPCQPKVSLKKDPSSSLINANLVCNRNDQ